jgi:hypothetical protein
MKLEQGEEEEQLTFSNLSPESRSSVGSSGCGGSSTDKNCPICLEKVHAGTLLFKQWCACRLKTHDRCMQKWIAARRRVVCPTCRSRRDSSSTTSSTTTTTETDWEIQMVQADSHSSAAEGIGFWTSLLTQVESRVGDLHVSQHNVHLLQQGMCWNEWDFYYFFHFAENADASGGGANDPRI